MHISPISAINCNQTKVLGISLVFRGSDGVLLGPTCVTLPPLDPTDIGQDRNRVVGGDIGPSVPHTSHLFDVWVGKEKLGCFGHFSGCLGALMGSPWDAGV